MKDKEKQIEEIKNMIFDYTEVERRGCSISTLAKMIYNKILPEDSIVLSKEEYTELKKYKTDWLNSEKMHLQAELEYAEFELDCVNQSYSQLSKLYDETIEKLKKYEEFNNNLIVDNTTLKDKIELKGKETAEKILKYLLNFIENDTFHIGYELDKVDQKLNELAKQYGVDIKE